MKRQQLIIIHTIKFICAHNVFPLFLFIIITAIAVHPAFALRRTSVHHLFDITGDLNAPSDVSVSRDGRIYVVDGVNSKIKIFDPKGKLISSFGRNGSKNGEFMFPLGINIDRSGKVYIADSGNHRVQIFTPEGIFIAEIPLPSGKEKPSDPTDVVVDETRNRCYIVDNDNHRIMVYNLANFKLIQTYGTPGTNKLAFRYPFSITLDKDNYLYIVDVINTRVQVLNPEGLFVAFIGGWGVEKGEFFRPKGVAIDQKNSVFVSDSYMGVIQVFDATREFYSVVTDENNSSVKKFKTPTGLFIDNNNRLYVVEMLANKVSVYRIEGDTGSN